MRRIWASTGLAALASALAALAAACAPQAPTQAPTAAAPSAAASPLAPFDAPSGAYRVDPSHATLLFRVNHLGFSHYTAGFSRFDADLTLDVEHPERSSVTARIDPRTLSLPNPPPGFVDELLGPQWLGAQQHPEITFRSTAVEPTGPRTARMTGELTLHGVTQPVTLDVTLNGGYRGHPMDPNARIGFSARGVLNRSAFGVTAGVPAPGSTMGVSDAVEVLIDAEFTGPALARSPQ